LSNIANNAMYLLPTVHDGREGTRLQHVEKTNPFQEQRPDHRIRKKTYPALQRDKNS
jgi:hypothetical protein